MQPPESGNRIAYDDEVAGFGLRLTAGGAKSFVLNYRVRDTGRERRITIGSAGDWSTTAARTKARELRRAIDDGNDPLGDIQEARAAPTVADLIARFEKEHLTKRRGSTVRLYNGVIKKYIRPQLGTRKVADIRFEDVDALHRFVTERGGAYVANRVMSVVSKMFNLAIRWRMRADNPVKGIERNPEAKRKRYLNGDELGRLTAVLERPTLTRRSRTSCACC